VNIQLHIERLILEGLPLEPGQRQALQAAIESELTRLLTDGGLAASFTNGSALPHLRTGDLHLTTPMEPAHLGGQIAHAVYGGLGQAGGTKP
jgi:hypothetical protein